MLSKVVQKNNTAVAKCTQVCIVYGATRPAAVCTRGGGGAEARLSVALGLAALPIKEHLLLLLREGLPFQSVLPAAIQQGKTVF